jgi:surface antigen
VAGTAEVGQGAEARITVSGLIGCEQGPFVGVWVVSSRGGSGWAYWARHGSAAIAYYSRTFTTRVPTTVTLHIGCEGTKKKWGVPMSSASLSAGSSTALNDWCDPASASCAPFTPPAYAGWASDWAGPAFCADHPVGGAPYGGTMLAGVATCGTADGPYSNYQGEITYNGQLLDSFGYQCVEYAERYFYYLTGQPGPVPGGGGDASYFAETTQHAYPQYGLYPPGGYQGTGTFNNTITPGTIISMWSGSDPVGHVAVVSSVQVSNGNGTIVVADENAKANGTDSINVTNGQMAGGQAGQYNEFQWIYGLPDPRLYVQQ